MKSHTHSLQILFITVAILLFCCLIHSSTAQDDLSREERIKREIVAGVKKLCRDEYEGDFDECFKGISGDDNELNDNEIENVLEEIDVGNFITRGIIANKIIDQFDENDDNEISLEEFKKHFEMGEGE